MLTVKLFFKPHISQYLRVKYGEPFKPLAHNAFGRDLNRCLGPENYDTNVYDFAHLSPLKIRINSNTPNKYLAPERLREFSIDIEKTFWLEVKDYIREKNEHIRNTSAAIELFYQEFEITEDMYSMDNFRRQLIRLDIHSNREALPREPRYFRKVSNQVAREICFRYRFGYSFRELGEIFGIHHTSVAQIIKKSEKVSQLLSQKSTETHHFLHYFGRKAPKNCKFLRLSEAQFRHSATRF